MKKQLGINLLLSFIAGALVWALSPLVTGKNEPWDAEGVYYPVALLLAGLLIGLIRPQQITVHYPGVLLGQLTYMIVFLPGGPLLLVGVGFLMFYSFLFLAAAAGGAGIRWLFRRRWPKLFQR